MEPYLGEIKLMAINFEPRGWALCDGRLLPIAQNQALYSLLNTFYGGDGRTNFALPDLRGRVPVHIGKNQVGAKGGSETVTLTVHQLPPHTHNVAVLPNAGNQVGGLNHHIAAAVTRDDPPQNVNLYAVANPNVPLNPDTVNSMGGGSAHNNMQPYLALNYFIATQGIYLQRP